MMARPLALRSPLPLATCGALALALVSLGACGDDGSSSGSASGSASATGTASGGTASTSGTSSTSGASQGSGTNSGGTMSGGTMSGGTMSGGTMSGGTMSGGTISGGSDTGTGGTGGTGGTSMGSTSGGTTGGVQCDCVQGLDDGVFVLGSDATVWKYLPDTMNQGGAGTFSKVGDLNCGGNTNTFSMAVDRLGFAWVMFGPTGNNAGDIWKVDLQNNATCTDPGYTPGQMGVGLYGMAFVSKSEFDQCDKLYGNTFDGVGSFSEGPNAGTFLSMDPDTLMVSTIASTDYNGAELTGTGDGRAFMFAGTPAKLIEIDKNNGNIISTQDLGLDLTNAFAFAFFNGDFYFFTEAGGFNSNSKVTWLDFDDSEGKLNMGPQVINMSAPIRIVGAGVSTCAPTLPQ